MSIDASELIEIEQEIQKLEKIAKTKPKASDPFDAKIFNSRYRKDNPENSKLPAKPLP